MSAVATPLAPVQVRPAGRNDSRVEPGPNGLVLVKRFEGERDDAVRRYRRSLDWETVQRAGGPELSPPVLAHDDLALELTFSYVTDAMTLEDLRGDLSRAGEVTALLARCGRAIGQIHTTEPPAALDRHPAPEPSQQQVDAALRRFVALTPEEFAASSGAELACWQLFHHDDELRDALAAWVRRSAAAPQVLSHGDLRPDQFLVVDDELLVVDWEELCVAPATRDLAGVVGVLVFEALWQSFDLADVGVGTLGALDRTIVSRVQAGLAAVRPDLSVLLGAYEQQVGNQVDRLGLAADVGWQLIERVLARAMMSFRLPAGDRAIAGLGRQALLHPAGLAGLFETGTGA